MGMEVESSRMGMEHRNRPGLALQLRVVAYEGAHRLPARADQVIVERLLVGPHQRAQRLGDGKGQQEIGCRHLLGELTLEPLLTLVMLTVRAGTMAAGVRDKLRVAAVPALRPHQGAGRGAAALQGVQGVELTGQDRLAVRGPIVRLEGGDDGGEQDHFTPLQWMEKPLIKSLMACSALPPVRELRWV
jgi:hypothetical protein